MLAFVTALPPTLALVMAFWLDESPTWLAGSCPLTLPTVIQSYSYTVIQLYSYIKPP